MFRRVSLAQGNASLMAVGMGKKGPGVRKIIKND